MNKYVLAGAAALAIPGAAIAAPLPTIQYTNGVYSIPSSTTAQIFEEFNGGVAGTDYNASTQRSGPYTESTSGTGRVITGAGNVPGSNLNPDGGGDQYLAVQGNGLFTVNFAPTLTSVGVTVFSFVFGTLDTYNTLRLYFQDGTSHLYTGAEIIGLSNTLPNPGTYNGVSGRVTYDTGGATTITRAEFGSTGYNSFEIDSLAAAVPEPATWGLMILGFGMAGSALRVRRRKVSYSLA